MTEEERMLSGRFFASEVPELVEKKLKTHNLNIDYNKLHEDQTEERDQAKRAKFSKNKMILQ